MANSEEYDGIFAGMVDKGKERIYVGVREFRGAKFIDIRIHYESKEGWRPSKKGVTMPVEAFPEFAETILSLQEVLD